jgi:hypothetical protein
MRSPFGFLAPKDFQIIWLFNLLTLSVKSKGLRMKPNGLRMKAKND